MKRIAPAVTALMVFAIITSVSLAQRPSRPGGGGVDATAFDASPLPKDEVESKVLFAMEEMRKGPRYRNVSIKDGRLL